MIAFCNALADFCDAVAAVFTEHARQLRRCPECGENQFYGKPCKNALAERSTSQ